MSKWIPITLGCAVPACVLAAIWSVDGDEAWRLIFTAFVFALCACVAAMFCKEVKP